MIQSSLTRLGFLDPNFEEAHAAKPDDLKLCQEYTQRLTQLGHDILYDVAFDEDNAQELLCVCLFQRALTSLQAIVLLSLRGLRAEGIVVTRTLLEVMFRIVAIAKDPAVGLEYIKQDERHRLKILNKFSRLSPSAKEDVDLPKLEELRERVRQELADRQIAERSVEWFAEKAELLDFYVSVYAWFSSTTHVNVRDLEQEFVADENGRLLGFRYFPRFESMPSVLLAAFEAFIFAMRAVSSVLETKREVEIDQIHEEFKVLFGNIRNAPEA